MGGENFNDVAAHTKRGTVKGGVVAGVLQFDETLEQFRAVDFFAGLYLDGHLGVGFHRADAIDAGDRGNDDHVVALQQCARGGMAHAVDLLVDGGVFFDIGVGARNVRFGLVVVVIGDEIFDRVIRKELLHLAVQLRRQGFVRGQHQGRAVQVLNGVRNGEGLARPGDAQQNLIALALLQPPGQFGNGLWLIAGRLKTGDHAQLAATLDDGPLFRDEDGALEHGGSLTGRFRICTRALSFAGEQHEGKNDNRNRRRQMEGCLIAGLEGGVRRGTPGGGSFRNDAEQFEQ